MRGGCEDIWGEREGVGLHLRGKDATGVRLGKLPRQRPTSVHCIKKFSTPHTALLNIHILTVHYVSFN